MRQPSGGEARWERCAAVRGAWRALDGAADPRGFGPAPGCGVGEGEAGLVGAPAPRDGFPFAGPRPPVKGPRMAKKKLAGLKAFGGAKLEGLRVESAPEWQELQAKRERVERDLAEAEADVAAALEAFEKKASGVDPDDLNLYLSGKVAGSEGLRAHAALHGRLGGARKQFEEAQSRLEFVRAAEGELREQEEALRERLSGEAAQAMFGAYAEIERRILRASAELRGALLEQEAFLEEMQGRGFRGMKTRLAGLMVRAARVENDAAAVASLAYRPHALNLLGDRRDDGFQRYLATASKALGENLPGVH